MNKSFHFIAIGGVGQSALAKILLIKGFEVTGSDIVESKYTKMLQNLGAKIFIGHDKKNVKEGQTVVLSSAIKENNPEVIRAKELGLEIFHRSDILKLISTRYETFVGFSGTHGKTTMSALFAYILEKIGAKPAYATGGIITGLETNSNAYPESKIFSAELDESDGTIIKYKPDYLVVNNLEPDHLDFYKNGEKDLIAQFEKLMGGLKPDAKVFINIDDKGASSLLDKNKLTYSVKNRNADYYADDIKFNSFTFCKNNSPLCEVKMGIGGLHNVYNTLSVLCVLERLGFDIREALPHIQSFTGAKRRFETVYDKEIKIVDDYAHHPTEIKAVLSAAKAGGNGKITAIFQPHRYTRLKALWKDFLGAFEPADRLFVVDTYSAGDNFDPEFNSENFAKEINHKCVKYISGDMENAAGEISKYIKKGDFILTIGAGDVTKIGKTLGGYYERNRTQN